LTDMDSVKAFNKNISKMNRKLKVGLFGFGCVGQGLYDILCKNEHFNSEVVAICVKNKDKQRSLPSEMFVYDKWAILNNDQLDLIVEMISDTQEAFIIASEALKRGKKVISASKKMIAENFETLYQLQKQYGGALLYEAACCGSIPIIRNLEEYFDNEPLHSVYGIFNGSSNYILTRIFKENSSYAEALKQAQELGFAEADPTLDVGGGDAANKVAIICAHAFGNIVRPEQVFSYGIQNLEAADVAFAKKRNLKIKLLAKAAINKDGKLSPSVMPAFVDESSALYTVENELNTVLVNGRFSGTQQFKGKGAGGHPTGSAVLSDISASLYHYRYEYKKLEFRDGYPLAEDAVKTLYIRGRVEEVAAQLGLTSYKVSNEPGEDSIIFAETSLKKLAEKKEWLQANNVFIADTSELSQSSLETLALAGERLETA